MTYLRNEDGKVVLNEWICVDDGLVEVLVEDLPREGEPHEVLDLQVQQAGGNLLGRVAQPFVTTEQIFKKIKDGMGSGINFYTSKFLP